MSLFEFHILFSADTPFEDTNAPSRYFFKINLAISTEYEPES